MCLAGTLLLPSGPQDNFYCEKIRVFKACDFQALNTLAWNNRIGPGSYSVGLFDQVMINRDGRGHLYSSVRGEILGPLEDNQLRKRLPRTFSLIKNESKGIEDDQIPS